MARELLLPCLADTSNYPESDMLRRGIRIATVAVAMLGLSAAAQAMPVAISFTGLSGSTGGFPAGTGVYRASLDGLGVDEILSITIQDASFGLGGSPGQFSGFDLDAIVLPTNWRPPLPRLLR